MSEHSSESIKKSLILKDSSGAKYFFFKPSLNNLLSINITQSYVNKARRYIDSELLSNITSFHYHFFHHTIFHFKFNNQIGPDESHTIHKIRATTIIFEEDSSFDEPVIANIVLPNRPHATTLQVEEVGSFKLETNEQSVTYQVGSGDGRHGIIDEMDSDNEHNYTQKRGASRNISIVSASEDENSVGYAREVSVDEFQKDYQFEDGYANVKIKRTVVEEEEVYMGDIDDQEEPFKAKLYEVKETVGDEVDNPTPTKVKVSEIANGKAESTDKALLCDVEEKEEHSSLSAEEAKQLRIKEIRAKARKASIVNKEEMTTNTVQENLKTAEINEEPSSKSTNANLLNSETVTEHNTADDEATSQYGNYDNAEENECPQKGKERQLCEVELDDDFENLMKRAQRQRSILNDILDKEHGISSEEDMRQKTNKIEIVEDSDSLPGIKFIPILRHPCNGKLFYCHNTLTHFTNSFTKHRNLFLDFILIVFLLF